MYAHRYPSVLHGKHSPQVFETNPDPSEQIVIGQPAARLPGACIGKERPDRLLRVAGRGVLPTLVPNRLGSGVPFLVDDQLSACSGSSVKRSLETGIVRLSYWQCVVGVGMLMG